MTQSAFSRPYAAFRSLLVAARRSAGLTQADLARKIRRPQSFVSKYERGERRLDVIEFIEVAEALGLRPEAVVRDLAHRSTTAKGRRK